MMRWLIALGVIALLVGCLFGLALCRMAGLSDEEPPHE